MAPLKVIGGGYGRTGTDSLKIALNILGYKTHHMKSFFDDSNMNPDDFYNAYMDRDNADWDKLYENYDAAVDWPTVAFYKELLMRYPNAKVILTVRSAESWYESVKNTIHKAAVEKSSFPKDHPMARFARMTSTICLDGKIADPDQFNDEEAIKKLFTDHIEEVKKNVPVEQLYVMELGSGWDGLCKFLGKDVPKVPYPSSNSTNEFSKNFTLSSKDIKSDDVGFKAST